MREKEKQRRVKDGREWTKEKQEMGRKMKRQEKKKEREKKEEERKKGGRKGSKGGRKEGRQEESCIDPSYIRKLWRNFLCWGNLLLDNSFGG